MRAIGRYESFYDDAEWRRVREAVAEWRQGGAKQGRVWGPGAHNLRQSQICAPRARGEPLSPNHAGALGKDPRYDKRRIARGNKNHEIADRAASSSTRAARQRAVCRVRACPGFPAPTRVWNAGAELRRCASGPATGARASHPLGRRLAWCVCLCMRRFAALRDERALSHLLCPAL